MISSGYAVNCHEAEMLRDCTQAGSHTRRHRHRQTGHVVEVTRDRTYIDSFLGVCRCPTYERSLGVRRCLVLLCVVATKVCGLISGSGCPTYERSLDVRRCLVLLCVVATKVSGLVAVRECSFVRILLAVRNFPRAASGCSWLIASLLDVHIVSGNVGFKRCRAKPIAVRFVFGFCLRHFWIEPSV